MVLWAAPGATVELPFPPDPPFRAYTVADGLNQRTVIAVEQDNDGYLWIATFGGLNRFDGRTFESYTTLQGLRQNLIQALMVDSQNRLWAGDAAGGLTVIQNGEVIRTYDPHDAFRGVARAILEVGDALYIGTQPGGIRRLDLTDPTASPVPIEGAPAETLVLLQENDKHILVISTEGLHRLNLDGEATFTLIDPDVSAIDGTTNGAIYVGSRSGKVGLLNADGIGWFDQTYPASITGLTVFDGNIEWVFLEGRGMMPFGEDPNAQWSSTSSSASPKYDSDGVLWLPTRLGLLRYLGERFRHYSLEMDDQSPEVFAILPGLADDLWLGTNLGIIHIDAEGTFTNISDQLGIDRREVRDLRLSKDRSTLWVGHVPSPLYGIDLASMEIIKTIGDQNTLTVALEMDEAGHLWAGSYLGKLDRYDQATDTLTTYEIGNGAAIYGLDLADDGMLWFAANYRGLYRIDTRDPNAQPEQVLEAAPLEEEFFTHVVAEGSGDATKVWFTTTQGGVYVYSDGVAERAIPQELLQNNTVYAVQPLPNDNVIVATSRGVYRYDRQTRAIEQYNSEDGFTAIESKAHAVYFDQPGTLWIGTTSGLTAMDVSMPMAGVGVPKTLINARMVDEVMLGPTGPTPGGLSMDQVLIEFGSVSMLKPKEIQYSYRLIGSDDAWSQPTTNASINYTNLPPGPYVFEVRSRLPGGAWSDADSWSFVVPTPYWRTPWFITLMVVLAMALTWFGIQLRLRAVANINSRLRQQVAERTRSIEQGREELERINAKLSSEITERKRADEARADVEARFHQAYQNSPIGMALVNTEGLVYDANPAMKELFWPESNIEAKEPLISVVADADKAAFEAFFADFATRGDAPDKRDNPNMEVACLSATGTTRRINFHPSAVRDNSGRLKYIVLLANDVTESRAMTDQLEYQAKYDELTGLYNRRAFAEQLDALYATDPHVGDAYLMFLDLDQFKVVNDTSGHAAGDELLRRVATLIQEHVRSNDVIARLGGDEFGVVLRGCTQNIALDRAEKIREAIQDFEFLWDAQVFRIGVSIGIVAVESAEQDLNELQQLADAACYAAKEAGRNRVHLVESDSDAAHEHRGEMRWVQRLNAALDQNNFVLYGQRIVALDSDASQPERIEVLLRMRDRENNRLIPPGAFLPAAERYGLHGRLDQWVVRQVIDTLAAQPPEDVANQEIWVNLSGGTVGDAKLSQNLIRQVANADLPPGSLNFEITETAVIRRIDDATRLIAALREMGCRFALDDFGSGLSSFGYLKRLNVDCLKIDGQFVRDIATDPTDRIFVKSIIDIAHTHGMRIVAEFVENEEVLEEIRKMGSDYGQGFGIHRPEPLDSMVSLTTIIRNAGL
ncbi:MAG: EAL domain-containing protein [Pseudomonadota bacterium]